ncbi:MFS transporter [Tundrisphaera lichenicola]|uniref:MFS transporter n=1 Tax=Tundrisphaera lichenicola TaxID=2029860 RepID=UPI003EBA15A4
MDPIDREFSGAPAAKAPGLNEKLLFWACFMSIVATAFGFIIRSQIVGDWAREYGLGETEVGKINGVGLWPFAISIVVFSLIIDKIGYGKAMIFAFVCHVSSAVLTILTPRLVTTNEQAYNLLYFSTFILALGNGTVEAVANPVVANLFPREKTKYLNMLHAGWPGGLVLGGIIALLMGGVGWQYKVGLIFLPVLAYAVLMFGRTFPVSERVTAGVSFKAMLKEVGVIGAAIIVAMIVRQIGDVFALSLAVQLVAWAALVIGYGAYIGFAPGQPMFILLMLIMIPLATTELGTDSWISPLMEPVMIKDFGISGGWVLVYTSLIMLILRFFAGPIVHKLSPLGLLCVSSAIAAAGLIFLSRSTGVTILLAATLYGLGKAFFWPTMLGVAAEQFPKGGALTLNTLGGLGMLAVGVLGAPFQGFIQDTKVDRDLASANPAVYEKVINPPKQSVFGEYRAVDPNKVEALAEGPKAEVTAIQDAAKRNVLVTTAIFPVIMLVCYLGLILYFRSKGGYKPQVIISDKEEELLMTGGAVGPAEF